MLNVSKNASFLEEVIRESVSETTMCTSQWKWRHRFVKGGHRVANRDLSVYSRIYGRTSFTVVLENHVVSDLI
jgi:hypothetical protein